MGQTGDQLVDRALGRLAEFGVDYPTARGPMYRRIGYRQRQLYEKAAQINPERFGTCATANLSSGNADLNDFADPVPTPALVQRIEVLDPGTSAYAAGDKINLVRPEDQNAEYAPRAYLRDRVLISVGTDLNLVTSIKIFYAKLPALWGDGDAAKAAELEAPWDTLLELDLAKWLTNKASATPQEKRALALGSFDAEEKDLLADFQAHVGTYTPLTSRFLAPHVHSRLDG